MFKGRAVGYRFRYLGMGVAILMLLLGVSTLSAQGASSVAQGFRATDSNVLPSALVSLKNNTPNTIELATQDNVDRLLGVVGEKADIELSGGEGILQVVTNGTTPTLVSDINGDIRTGDNITTSPIAGVGMKATFSTVVIGTAQADLGSVKTDTQTITNKSGKSQTVHIGAVRVQVDKVFYQAPQDQNSFLPPALQDFAASIAGHQVSAVRVLMAGLLVLMLFVVVTILLYSAVHSSIVSIGRNPLSEGAVRKSLLQVGLAVVGILVFTLIVIYLILTA